MKTAGVHISRCFSVTYAVITKPEPATRFRRVSGQFIDKSLLPYYFKDVFHIFMYLYIFAQKLGLNRPRLQKMKYYVHKTVSGDFDEINRQ